MHGVCHFEIPTTDLERSKTHLGGLFGWEFMPMDENYWLFRTGEGPGGGLEKVAEPKTEGAIGIYVEVESIEDCLAKSGELGGEVHKPKTEIGGGYGFYATVVDPGGTTIGLWESQT